MVLSVNKFPELQALLAAGDEIMLEDDGRIVARVTAVPVKQKQRIAGLLRGKIRVTPDFDDTPEDLLELFLRGEVFPKG